MLKNNVLKEKLQSGKPVIGTWNTLGSPLVTEVIAHSGLDFQIIDLEHGPFTLDQVHLHVSACENIQGCTPLVRVPSNEEWMILQALDQGAYGVVVPHISNKQAAEKLVSSIKYYPSGNRGFTPFSKAGGFNNVTTKEYVESANSGLMSIAIIESKEGIDEIDAILEVEDQEVIYFGAYDLSQALGHPGETKHPDVIKAISHCVDKVVAAGKCAGGFVPQTKDDIKWLLDMGMRFITYDVDSSILYRQSHSIVEWFDKEFS
jgi:4-hydroxy-2-oxoheptanedioate aldolase